MGLDVTALIFIVLQTFKGENQDKSVTLQKEKKKLIWVDK